jgi:hypothetical protein
MKDQSTTEDAKDLDKYEARQPAVVPPAETNLLELVIQRGADLQTIEKFMDLQERHEKNEARKAFVIAMAAFKANPPEIIKDMAVSFDLKAGGKTSYKHADLAKATRAISQELSKHGLSGTWTVDQESGIKVTYILTHIMGHSESVSMTAPPDASGGKNPIQAIASTVSYLERYTMLAGTGLAAKGMDTDGKKPKEEAEPINQDQIDKIEGLRKSGSADKKTFAAWIEKEYGAKTVNHLDTVQGAAVIERLKAKATYTSKLKDTDNGNRN